MVPGRNERSHRVSGVDPDRLGFHFHRKAFGFAGEIAGCCEELGSEYASGPSADLQWLARAFRRGNLIPRDAESAIVLVTSQEWRLCACENVSRVRKENRR